MVSGNISLVDQIGSVQLAIQSAIRTSTSPEILNMFLKKENGSLRSKLAILESDFRLGRISVDSYNSQALEIIKLLEKLKEPLSPSEQEILRKVLSYPIQKHFFFFFVEYYRKIILCRGPRAWKDTKRLIQK
jgi:hypothetical protein